MAGAPGALHRLSILGAGAEGCWLAGLAARAGYRVTLEDLFSGRRRSAAALMQTLLADGEAPRYPLVYAVSVEEAAREADLVIDFVPDELESKLEIFSLLDRMAPPHTIFATPTRALSIADLASCTYRGDRCVALKLPALPAAGAFTVEIVASPGSAAGVVEAVGNFWRSLGASVSTSIDLLALP